MSKPEWEKTRDTFDYVNALKGQASVGLHGALGDEARRATAVRHRPPKRQKKKATSNVMAGARAKPSAETSQRVRDLPDWLATVGGIICFLAMFVGAYWGAFEYAEFADMPFWQRAGAGALIGFTAPAIFIYATFWIVSFLVHVILPALIRLAAVAAVVWVIALLLSDKL